MELEYALQFGPLAMSAVVTGYCMYRLHKVKKAPQLEAGVQGAVKMLSAQVTELQSSYERVQLELSRKEQNISKANERAQKSVEQLKLLISSLHDLPGYQGFGEK